MDGMQLSVMTFNVLQLPVLSLTPAGRRRSQLALRLITDSAPDVVVLNEAFSLSFGRIITAGLRRLGYLCTGQGCALANQRAWQNGPTKAPLLRRVIGSGVHIFSKFPILQQHQLAYRARHTKTQDSLSAMGAAVVKLQLPAGKLWLAATHLQADQPPVPVAQTHAVRMAQLCELRDFVAATVPPTDAVVLAGDLNIEYFGDPGSKMPGVDHLAANAVIGGRIEPANEIVDFSFDGVTNPVVASSDRSYRNTLDYVGYFNESTERAVPRINTEILTFTPGQEASDHQPVLARVILA